MVALTTTDSLKHLTRTVDFVSPPSSSRIKNRVQGVQNVAADTGCVVPMTYGKYVVHIGASMHLFV